MALDAPADIRRRVGLDELRAARVRRAMLAGRLEEAAEHLPESLLDLYAISGTPAECAAAIAGLRGSFDLFVLPMNDEETCEQHMESSAAILAVASDLPAGEGRQVG